MQLPSYDQTDTSLSVNFSLEGEIVFRREGANAVLKVKFKNAYCIGFDRIIDAVGGIRTVLTISPEQVWLNDIEFYNRWPLN
ncbi:type VI secretion system tube protein TssD [Geofilum rubicundum]|uniref:Uncharacterized protein n=1 Tax=Geofilum rubicundum JCM 15548 TaxID=1236989 RepID=A0A0E9LPZ4_9BACT|nr:type VI secretion system tube protein TssD [Geofilum rubicundum]GAO27667.1 hypothetical protein JCM15548_14508 [Geofilum rubicundum JCM 15548]